MEVADKAAWVRGALQRYEGPLLRYAGRIVGDRDLARDVVQDAFLSLCKADPGKVNEHLTGWLYTVVRNRALNVAEKERRMTPLEPAQAETHPTPSPGPSDTAARNERSAMVWQALARLPERQQEACRLKFQDGLTYREISQVMGISLGSVSNMMAQALDAVRGQLRGTLDLAQEA